MVLSTVSMSSTAPVLALAARSGTVDLSSLSPGTAALAVGLVLSFLAPVVVLLLTTDEGASNERTMANGLTREERPPNDERATAIGPRNGSPSATHTERSTATGRENTRESAERSKR